MHLFYSNLNLLAMPMADLQCIWLVCCFLAYSCFSWWKDVPTELLRFRFRDKCATH